MRKPSRPGQTTDAAEAKPVKAAKERTARSTKAAKERTAQPTKEARTPQDDVRSFLEVPIQDITRDPLVEGQTLPRLCVVGLLAIAKKKIEGNDLWNNFNKKIKDSTKKSEDGETLMKREGVEIIYVKVVGNQKARRAKGWCAAWSSAPLLGAASLAQQASDSKWSSCAPQPKRICVASAALQFVAIERLLPAMWSCTL